jgi:hypothetical protein
MKKTRLIFLLCALTAALWSLPGLAQAKAKPSTPSTTLVSQTSSMFDGHSMFDGPSMFDGGSAFDGH